MKTGTDDIERANDTRIGDVNWNTTTHTIDSDTAINDVNPNTTTRNKDSKQVKKLLPKEIRKQRVRMI